MTREEWLKYGYEQGFCGAVVCLTHDGTPLSEQEEKEFYEDNEICVWAMRMYPDLTTRTDVEENHSPSVWRLPWKK